LIANPDNYRENKDWFENVWRQIANEFKDYDERLLFEGCAITNMEKYVQPADVNGDGVVNAADIVEIVNIIMGH
jgi:hypothetical protein